MKLIRKQLARVRDRHVCIVDERKDIIAVKRLKNDFGLPVGFEWLIVVTKLACNTSGTTGSHVAQLLAFLQLVPQPLGRHFDSIVAELHGFAISHRDTLCDEIEFKLFGSCEGSVRIGSQSNGEAHSHQALWHELHSWGVGRVC